MTTATQSTRTGWVRGAALAAAAAIGSGLVISIAGAVVDGRAGGVGAATGSLLVGVVLLSGTVVVGIVSDLLPGASLLLALLTYTLQVVVLGVVLASLRGRDGIADTLSPPWFAAAVVTGALVWTVVQVVTAVRARIPTYALPTASAHAAGSRGREGSA